MIRPILHLLLILLIQGIAKGLEPEDSYPTLEAGGVVYTNVTVTSRTSSRLMISHSRGINTVLIEDLEPELRKKYLTGTTVNPGKQTAPPETVSVAGLEGVSFVAHQLITNSELRYSIQVSNAYIFSSDEKKLLQAEIERFARANNISIKQPLKVADSWSVQSEAGYDPILFAIIPLGEYGNLEISHINLRRVRDLPMVKAVASFESTFRSTEVATYRLEIAEDSEEYLGFFVLMPLKPQVLFIEVLGSPADEPQLRAELAKLLANLEGTLDHQRIALREDNSISPTGWRMIAWWGSVTAGLVLMFVFLYKWLIRGTEL